MEYVDRILTGDTTGARYVYDPTNKEYEWQHALDFVAEYKYLFAAASIVYLPLVLALRLGMQEREPFKLRWWRLIHNAVFTVFSAAGAYYTGIALFNNYVESNYDFVTSVRLNSYTHKEVGWWVFVFCVSKMVELTETVTICLEKKKLLFLHWLHHILTFNYCWLIILHPIAAGLHFCAMNFAVHAVMYLYYFLASYNGKPPAWGALVTSVQLIQMVVGVAAVTLSSLHCPLNHFASVYGIVMYVIYLVLFAELFYSKYINAKPRKKRTADGSSAAATNGAKDSSKKSN